MMLKARATCSAVSNTISKKIVLIIIINFSVSPWSFRSESVRLAGRPGPARGSDWDFDRRIRIGHWHDLLCTSLYPSLAGGRGTFGRPEPELLLIARGTRDTKTAEK